MEFIFYKDNLGMRYQSNTYENIKFESNLIVPKKNSELNQLDFCDESNEQFPSSTTVNTFNSKSHQENMKERYFMLAENRIIKFTNFGDHMEKGILIVKNARLKRIKLKDDNQKLWGFIIMSKGRYHKFYHSE